MTVFLTLAAEEIGEKTWWNPYLKGALVFLMAMGLFTGAAYLLLYTNVGSRLGFLLTASAFTGFMAVLSVFWITGQFPNGPVGPSPSWEVEDVVTDLGDTRVEAVRDIRSTGEEADSDVVGQVTADLDVELTDGDGEFDLFRSPGDYLAVRTFQKGGGRKWPIWWSEHTNYAVTEVCHATTSETLPLEPPASPECDESEPHQFVVAIQDLGARRLPSWFFFGASTILFALSLYSLHRYELDQQPDEPDDGDGGAPTTGGDGEAPGGNGRREPEPATTPR